MGVVSMFVWHLLLADEKHCSAACVLNNSSLAKIYLLRMLSRNQLKP